ncbi:unnamed protein product [Closterium sp. Yama58-4]|nr:unnamed protein product [Closterium sp. Yama58-4]
MAAATRSSSHFQVTAAAVVLLSLCAAAVWPCVAGMGGVYRPFHSAAGGTPQLTPQPRRAGPGSSRRQLQQGVGGAISYKNNGPVMFANVSVNFIWYGGVIAEDAKQAMRNFVRGLTNTSDPANTLPLWWNINRRYTNYMPRNVTGNITLGRELVVAGGDLLTYNATMAVVRDAIAAGLLNLSANEITFLVSANTITQTGIKSDPTKVYCVDYCSWHNFFTYNSTNIKFVWMGDPTDSCARCGAPTEVFNYWQMPHGVVPVDGLVNQLAYHMSVTTTNWDLRTWTDSTGYENAQKCIGWFGGYEELHVEAANRSMVAWNQQGLNGERFIVQGWFRKRFGRGSSPGSPPRPRPRLGRSVGLPA